MKKFTSISILLFLLLGVGFFSFSKAQIWEGSFLNFPEFPNSYQFGYDWFLNYDAIFSYNNLQIIKNVFRLEDVRKNLPSLMAQNNNILSINNNFMHASADQENIHEIDNNQIIAFLKSSQDFEEFYQKVRIDIIKFLIEKKYSGFDNQPYQDGNRAIAVQSGDFKVLKEIQEKDNLDILLQEKLNLFKDDFANIQKYKNYVSFKNIKISTREYQQLGKIFMFKNEKDLRDLGYELISRKLRINTDPDYRRHNIMTAFKNIGNLKLIMSGEIFSLAKEFHYSPYTDDESMPYVAGYATIGGGVELVYGGGLCGVATAFYQGTLTNLGLDLIQYRAHSIYYRNLYEAEINGKVITDPGLDATVFSPNFDIKVQNIRDYPIIVGFNFDGLSGHNEEVFTLSKSQDRGSFEYIGTYKKGGLQCFTRKINGENRTNCYNKIKNF